MTNANDAPWERAQHYYCPVTERVLCGKSRHIASSSIRRETDCKRCLASLAKRDRAFRAKARGWFKVPEGVYPWRASQDYAAAGRVAAARAIAREEGRA